VISILPHNLNERHQQILDKTKENHSISYDKSLQGKCITVYGINKIIRNKMKNTKYLTVRTISKSNIKIVERGTINTTNTQTHDNLIAWLGTGT
jgi:hypothetical protein